LNSPTTIKGIEFIILKLLQKEIPSLDGSTGEKTYFKEALITILHEFFQKIGGNTFQIILLPWHQNQTNRVLKKEATHKYHKYRCKNL
jgi:hypothetical protein